MPACGYEFYLLVFNSTSHSFAALYYLTLRLIQIDHLNLICLSNVLFSFLRELNKARGKK